MATETAQQVPKPLTKINPYDQLAVKQIVDDTVLKVVDEEGCVEDTLYPNIKIVCGSVCCALALVSHFYPVPFPNNIPILILCVAGYFIFSTISTLIIYFYEKEIIFSGFKGGDRKHPFTVTTRFPKNQEFFTIEVEKPNPAGTGAPVHRELSQSIGKWFDVAGGFLETEFTDDFKKLLKSLDHKKVD
eukprot:TRINITY_DN1496_c0_g1_i2.p1 TRINITY_DN1496_c0_g1~~TRINITY_DN1496_c0_g1_i2.p1  ORF type:complete len:188 (-),score=35.61 TRINITY_DN1496_c0_g1_i2:31-594(-)